MDIRANIRISNVCNNNCLFCIEDRIQRKKHLKPSSDKIYEQIIENRNINEIIISGGEPTLNKDIFKYIRLAKKCKYKKIILSTNGRLLSNNKYLMKLIDEGVNDFRVSFYSSIKQIHNSLTRSPDSYEQTIKGLENLTEIKQTNKEVLLTVNILITNTNLKGLKETIRFLVNKKIDRIHLNILSLKENFLKFKIPKFNEIRKEILDIIKDNYIMSNIKKFSVNLPYCIIPEYPLLISTYEKVSFNKEIEKIPKEYNKYNEIIKKAEDKSKSKKLGYLIISQNIEKNKIKINNCKKCTFNNKCDGIDKYYLLLYGNNEFKPIINT